MGQIRRRTVDLSDSIESTMLQQARRNELMIAYVRWLAITFKALVDGLAMAFPGGPFSERPISTANAPNLRMDAPLSEVPPPPRLRVTTV